MIHFILHAKVKALPNFTFLVVAINANVVIMESFGDGFDRNLPENKNKPPPQA